MGPIDRRERERQLLRRRILDAARLLFAEKGYEAVTIRTIAEAIEYSPRTLYLHFKDKEELIRELCMEDFRSFGETLAAMAQVPDPIERLRRIGRAYVQFAVDHPHHYKLMFMSPPAELEGFKDPNHGNPEQDAYALLRLCVQDAIAQGLFRPGITDPELVSQVVWSAVHGAAALHITHRCSQVIPWTPFADQVSLLLDTLMRGLQK